METVILKALNLSKTDYREWEQTDKENSFLYWAMKNDKLPTDQYKNWALQHYKIPFLNDSFFHNITINKQLWEQVKDREKWNDSFVPLYEWENILFAGCIEPPKNLQSENTVPVLSSLKNLNSFWKKIQMLSHQETKKIYSHTHKSNTSNTSTASNTALKTMSQNTDSNTFIGTILNKTIITKIKALTGSNVYGQVFKLSEKYFIGVIIFSFLNNEFKPIEWSDSMEGPATPIGIDKPSIFKMVVHSKNPYHGFIIDNEQHKKFFTPWGFNNLPEHVTLVPVFDGEKNIIGAFMGLGDKVIHHKYLHLIKKWVEPLSKIIQENNNSAA